MPLHIMQSEKDGTLLYKAASPDEEALCRGASDNKFIFMARDSGGVRLSIGGEDMDIEVQFRINCLMCWYR